MPSRPELYEGPKTAGLAAVALFVVLAFVFLAAGFGDGQGFAADAQITAGIGYLMFDMTGQTDLGTEGFLVAFIAIAIVLDAAIDGAVYLARREESDEVPGGPATRTSSRDGTATDGGEH